MSSSQHSFNDKQFEHSSVNLTLWPSWLGVLTYGLVSSSILLVLNISNIISIFGGGLASSDIKAALPSQLSAIVAPLFDPKYNNIGMLIVWAIIGCLVYMAVWVVQNLLGRVSEDITQAHYKNKSSKSNLLSSTLAHYIFFGCLAVIAFIYLSTFISVILPTCSKYFIVGIDQFPDFGGILASLLSIISLGISLYLIATFFKVIHRFWNAYIRKV